LGIGYWVLGIGYWVLGIGYWVLGIGAAQAAKRDEHDRGLGGIAIAELDDVIVPSLQTDLPIRRAVAIFDAFRTVGDGGEKLAMQVEVKDEFHGLICNARMGQTA